VGEPLYVVRVDAARNQVVVGREEDLLLGECTLREMNWVSCEPPGEPVEAQVKVRYRAQPVSATVTPLAGSRARIRFREPVRAVAPGQSAVFYRGDILLGGGIIEPGPVEEGLKTE